LLFETELNRLMDAVIVLSAPAEIQRARLLERPGMSAQKLEQLLARQLPDAEKRARADFVVDTGGSIEESRAQLDGVVAQLQSWSSQAYARHWA
jgi:dephospho-CoA kinase